MDKGLPSYGPVGMTQVLPGQTHVRPYVSLDLDWKKAAENPTLSSACIVWPVPCSSVVLDLQLPLLGCTTQWMSWQVCVMSGQC